MADGSGLPGWGEILTPWAVKLILNRARKQIRIGFMGLGFSVRSGKNEMNNHRMSNYNHLKVA